MKKVLKRATKKPKLTLKRLLKLKHHRHTGRRLGHSQTSFPALILLLLVCGLAVKPVYPLLGDTLSASGMVHIGVTVPGPPPSDAPSISSPTDRTTFTVPLISLSGTCDVDLTVKIFINNNFAGSTLCSSSGSFTLGVSLSPGTNVIIAYVYDNLAQAGPPSQPVTVYYNPPASAHATSVSGSTVAGGAGVTKPLLLTTSYSFSDLQAGQSFSWNQLISGGTPPYTLTINWGDGSSNIYKIESSGPYQLSHTFSRPGTYNINMHLEDALGRISILNVVAVVNGLPTITKFHGHSNTASPVTSNLYDTVITMLYKLSLLVVLVFWGFEVFTKSTFMVGMKARFAASSRA